MRHGREWARTSNRSWAAGGRQVLKTLGIAAALTVVAAAGIAYAAYCFTPSEAIAHRSPFLAINRSKFIEVTGFRVHFLDQGSGPPILMIHGGGTWLYSFRHNLEPLARSFRVIALDMPGHGYTKPTRSEARYDFETTDRVLREFLDAKGIPQASLVGHSWGGGWALHFAQRYPKRVRKLILLASSGLPGHERLEWELLKYPVIAELMANFFHRGHVESGLRAAFADPAIVTPEMVQEIYTPLSSPENRRAQVSYSRNLDWDETQTYLADTQIPTLIIWGSLDQYSSVADGRALAKAMPRSRFEVITGAGHNAHEEKPRDINELITAFLASHD
jgi:pimeloyl-ACP methyl ester carboxylesterase